MLLLLWWKLKGVSVCVGRGHHPVAFLSVYHWLSASATGCPTKLAVKLHQRFTESEILNFCKFYTVYCIQCLVTVSVRAAHNWGLMNMSTSSLRQRSDELCSEVQKSSFNNSLDRNLYVSKPAVFDVSHWVLTPHWSCGHCLRCAVIMDSCHMLQNESLS